MRAARVQGQPAALPDTRNAPGSKRAPLWAATSSATFWHSRRAPAAVPLRASGCAVASACVGRQHAGAGARAVRRRRRHSCVGRLSRLPRAARRRRRRAVRGPARHVLRRRGAAGGLCPASHGGRPVGKAGRFGRHPHAAGRRQPAAAAGSAVLPLQGAHRLPGASLPQRLRCPQSPSRCARRLPPPSRALRPCQCSDTLPYTHARRARARFAPPAADLPPCARVMRPPESCALFFSALRRAWCLSLR